MEQKRISPAVISIIVIVLIAIAAGAVYAVNSKKQSDSTTSTTDSSPAQTTTPVSSTTESTPASSTTPAASTSSYKDGTYTATGNYTTPGGSESIKVTVTLASDTISDVNATGSGTSGDTAQYQSRFLANYKSMVVSKSIDSVSLSRVAGSSLTSNGFNSAIEKIKNEATS